MNRLSSILGLAGLAAALSVGSVQAADLDYGYAPPPPVARVYERPVVIEEPVVVERPVVVAPRPYVGPVYRPFYRPWGYYRPYHPVYGPSFAYGPRPWGWYR